MASFKVMPFAVFALATAALVAANALSPDGRCASCPRLVSCNYTETPGASCLNCKEKLFCTHFGGIVTPCVWPGHKNCVDGKCVSEPSEECAPTTTEVPSTTPHVGSRRVVQYAAALMVVQEVLGKLCAVFIIIPQPIIGGLFFVLFGMISAFGHDHHHHHRTDEERGMAAWAKEVSLEAAGASEYGHTYNFPVRMTLIRRWKWTTYLPFMPTYEAGKFTALFKRKKGPDGMF